MIDEGGAQVKARKSSDGMEHAIEQAVEVISVLSGDSRGRIVAIAEMLAEAGLLAPSPLREEWGVRWDDHDVWGDMYRNRAEAEAATNGEGEPVHRWATDWEGA